MVNPHSTKMGGSSDLIPYIPIVDFLGNIMGKHCEVVLHDVRNLENSIIAIANGHVSNRKVGASITDLALKIVRDDSYAEKDFLLNYSGQTEEGNILRSSTFLIKNEKKKIIGLLCLNMDIGELKNAKDTLQFLIEGNTDTSTSGLQNNGDKFNLNPHPIEDFPTTIENLTSSVISKTLQEEKVSPSRMSAEEKIEIVRKLNEKGIFLIKGAISEVASSLSASEATIYRYLHTIDKNKTIKLKTRER